MVYSFGLKTKMTLSNGLLGTSLLVKHSVTLANWLKFGSAAWSNQRLAAVMVLIIISITFQVIGLTFDIVLLNCVENKEAKFVKILNGAILGLSMFVLVLDSIVDGLQQSLIEATENDVLKLKKLF